MTLCSNCDSKEKIRSFRSEKLRSGAFDRRETREFRSSSNPSGWHHERYWHGEAAKGNKIPKIR